MKIKKLPFIALSLLPLAAQAITVNTNVYNPNDDKCSFSESLESYRNNRSNGCDIKDKSRIVFAKELNKRGVKLDTNSIPLPFVINQDLVIEFAEKNKRLNFLLVDNQKHGYHTLFKVSDNAKLTLSGLSFNGKTISIKNKKSEISLVELLNGSQLLLDNVHVEEFGKYAELQNNYLSNTGLIYTRENNKAGTINIKNSVFVNNISDVGVVNIDADYMKITKSLFDRNEVKRKKGNNGGAINIKNAKTSIRHSRFIGNKGTEGAAIRLVGEKSNLLLVNSLFMNNHSYQKGSAIYSEANVQSYSSSLFYNNSEIKNASAIQTTNKKLLLVNTILAENLSFDRGAYKMINSDCSAILSRQSKNSILGSNLNCEDNGAVYAYPFNDEFNISLQGEKGKETGYVPLVSSVFYNAGDINGCKDEKGLLIEKDIAGMPRHSNGHCDIGASEVAAYDVLISANKFEYDASLDNNTKLGEVKIKFNVVNLSSDHVKNIDVSFINDKDMIVNHNLSKDGEESILTNLNLKPYESKELFLKAKIINKKDTPKLKIKAQINNPLYVNINSNGYANFNIWSN